MGWYWDITVEDHAVDRWRERYCDENEIDAGLHIINRMIQGLNEYYEVRRLAASKKLSKLMRSQESDKLLIYGDMSFVYSRAGNHVKVHTCYGTKRR